VGGNTDGISGVRASASSPPGLRRWVTGSVVVVVVAHAVAVVATPCPAPAVVGSSFGESRGEDTLLP